MSKNREQFTRVAHNLKRIRENTKRETPITFGIIFTAPYALFVHDDLQTVHSNGQSKFLEQPLRENAKRLTQMVKDLIKKGKTLKQAILEVAKWFLETLVKPLVPVKTGTLRDSGTVKLIR